MARNIFKDYRAVSSVVLNDAEGVYGPVANSLVNTLGKYFEDGLWARRESDKAFYRHACDGISTGVGAKLLGMNEDTYRGRLARISGVLVSELLGGSDLYDLILDEGKARVVLDRVVLKLKPFLLSEELVGGNLVSLLGSGLGDSIAGESATIDEKLKALVFVTSYAKALYELREGQVDKDALAFVLRNLTEGGEWCTYFRNLVRVMGNLRAPSGAALDVVLTGGKGMD